MMSEDKYKLFPEDFLKSLPAVKKVDSSLIQGMTLPKKYKIFERLKVVNPEVYFYWVLGVGSG